ncbi:hypothetical protein [Bacillus smithii]
MAAFLYIKEIPLFFLTVIGNVPLMAGNGIGKLIRKADKKTVAKIH